MPGTVIGRCRTHTNDIDTLLAFDSDYDQAGARTFACRLYTLDRCESALYWWRFAAGAGDPLAAHHAGADCVRDARLWRIFARMLDYTPDRAAHSLSRAGPPSPKVSPAKPRGTRSRATS
ncbi:hypothetical protein ABZX62_32995 [Streptomyces flavidovirens]|uniref:hypothetical protein n=1 Tax=Streptomyces flavidovirens TaxID=67298 RepID=UPI0033B5D407